MATSGASPYRLRPVFAGADYHAAYEQPATTDAGALQPDAPYLAKRRQRPCSDETGDEPDAKRARAASPQPFYFGADEGFEAADLPLFQLPPEVLLTSPVKTCGMSPAAGPRAWQVSPGIFGASGVAAAAAASPPPSSAPAPHGQAAMVAGPSSALGGGSSSFLDALGSLAPVEGRVTTCGPLMAANVAPHMPPAGTRRPPAAGPAPMAPAAANFRHAHSSRPSAAPCYMPLVGNNAAASGQTVAPAICNSNSYINTAPVPAPAVAMPSAAANQAPATASAAATAATPALTIGLEDAMYAASMTRLPLTLVEGAQLTQQLLGCKKVVAAARCAAGKPSVAAAAAACPAVLALMDAALKAVLAAPGDASVVFRFSQLLFAATLRAECEALGISAA